MMCTQFKARLHISSSHSYGMAQSALHHCHERYTDGGLTFDEYVVLEEAILAVMFRLEPSIRPKGRLF